LVLTDISQEDIHSALMPNTKSAIRRTRKTKQQALVNRIRKSKYKSTIKQMSTYLETGKIKEAKNFLPKFHSQLMKIAKTGVINRKTAARKISRFTKKINIIKK
jgi:small subunit ribosomal protein S20